MRAEEETGTSLQPALNHVSREGCSHPQTSQPSTGLVLLDIHSSPSVKPVLILCHKMSFFTQMSFLLDSRLAEGIFLAHSTELQGTLGSQ